MEKHKTVQLYCSGIIGSADYYPERYEWQGENSQNKALVMWFIDGSKITIYPGAFVVVITEEEE